MYLFPIVGIVIGLVIGSLGYGLSLYLEPLVVSLVVVASSFAVITGIHHTDGLADFADGLMTKGTKEKTQSNEGPFGRICWNILNSVVCDRRNHCIIT